MLGDGGRVWFQVRLTEVRVQQKSGLPMKEHAIRQRARWLVAGAISMLAVAGCAAWDGSIPTPEPSVAAEWPLAAESADGARVRAIDLAWRDYITYAPLQRLIETALANNRDLRLALLRVEEARAAYAIRRADQFPSLDASGRGARARVPGDLNISGQPATGGEYGVYVGISHWEMDLWGRVRSLKDAALREYLATEHARRGVRAVLIREVAQAYLRLREYDERIALADRMVASREESHRIFRRRNEVGSASDLELTQVETLLVQARTLEVQLRQARSAQAHALTVLVGAPLELPPVTDAATVLRDEVIFAELAAGLPAEVLSARPDIMAAEYRLAASQGNIHAARAAFFPRIALTGDIGSASAELNGLFDSGSRAWSFMPTISLPIFDGGRLRAGLDLAEVRRDMAVANYEKTVQNAFREVADALSTRQWLARQLALQREALEVQTRRARLAQLRYDSGAAAYLEVLDAQRDLLEAQQQLVQVRHNLLASHIALYTALGGGAGPQADLSTRTP